MERILDAWEENDAEEKRSGRRKGYMGHLTKIANVVAKYAEMSDVPSGPGEASSAHAQMKALPESVAAAWAKFARGGLAETNEKNVIVPASRLERRKMKERIEKT